MPRKIKLIVTDLDGTFLRENKTVSDYTKAVFSRCREAGIKLAYATGRGVSAHGVTPPGLFDGKIIMNGAIAKIGDDIVYRRFIPCELVRPFLIACDKRGIKITTVFNKTRYSNYIMSQITDFQIVDFAQHEMDAEEIYTYNPSADDKLFMQRSMPNGLYLVTSSNRLDTLLQITHKEATKSKAVMALAKIWGITETEIATFGNDFNDIDMLEYAGTGVAVANAFDEVKAAANHICDTNDNDGVAKWIDENILGRVSTEEIE